MVRHRRTICLLATFLVAGGSGACSLLFATSKDQCATDGDCTSRGAGFESMRCSADNACIPSDVVRGDGGDGAVDAAVDSAIDPFACANLPAPSPDPSKQIDMSMRYTDFSTGAPPENTLARLCAATDPNCENARASLTGDGPGDAGPEGGKGWVKVRADGTVTTKIELGFEGFFEARAVQYPPTFRSTSPALRNPKNEFDQLLLRPAEIKFLADDLLGKPNSYESTGHGLVFVFARDCNQNPIPGATFTTSATDPLMLLFYVINSAPSITDTKSDSLGRGGFLNAPPGIHTFNAFVGEGDKKKKIGSGRVLVRAGAATTIAVAPSQ
jgi:hypothetical protein